MEEMRFHFSLFFLQHLAQVKVPVLLFLEMYEYAFQTSLPH